MPTAAKNPTQAKDLMKLRIHLRNKYGRQLADWRAEHGAKADGETRTISELGAIHSAARASILASGLFEEGAPTREINMLAEMVAYGDSGAFLDKVGFCM